MTGPSERLQWLEEGPASAAEVLDAVEAFLRRYVIFESSSQAIAATLWAAHAHAREAAETTPRLAAISPEKQSGKTRLLEVLELLVPRPMFTSSTSVAVLFRSVDEEAPTILFDEADAVFGKRGDDGTEELRSLLNTGHRRGVGVYRMVGQGAKMHPQRFEVFAPVALASIRELPDTLMDRSIVLRMQRKRRDQTCEKFRRRHVRPQGERLREALRQWTEDVLDRLDPDPEVPETLSDRQADGWEALLALADAAGGDWPTRARAAAVELAGDTDDDASVGVLLLRDMRAVFEDTDDGRVSTTDALRALVEIESSPWGSWWGNDVEAERTKGPASRLARLLKPYGIEPKQLRIGAEKKRGYDREDFEDAWGRYVPRTEGPQRGRGRGLIGPDSDPGPDPDSGRTEPEDDTTIRRRSEGLLDPAPDEPETAPDQGCTDVPSFSPVQGGEGRDKNSGNGSRSDDDAIRSTVFRAAAELGFPTIRWGPAKVGSSEDGWRRFVTRSPENDLGRALEALAELEGPSRESPGLDEGPSWPSAGATEARSGSGEGRPRTGGRGLGPSPRPPG